MSKNLHLLKRYIFSVLYVCKALLHYLHDLKWSKKLNNVHRNYEKFSALTPSIVPKIFNKTLTAYVKNTKLSRITRKKIKITILINSKHETYEVCLFIPNEPNRF